MTQAKTDRWSSGSAYEAYVGRWSRRVAVEFLDWLAVPSGRRWLDLGCGTGALTETILERLDPRSVTGVDPSAAFLDHARGRVLDARATFRAGSADATGLPDDAVDAVVSGLVLNFVPDVGAALHEVRRVLAPEGTAGAYVWDYAEGMQFMRHFWDVATALDPAAAALDEGARFPIASPDRFSDAFSAAGLVGVEARAIDIPTVFPTFDDLWSPFLGGTGPGPVYVASLADEPRAALRDRYRETVGSEPDGSIHLTARAWAVKGHRPA